MRSLKAISDQIVALRLPILMAIACAVLFALPGQTKEIYRALAQLMATTASLEPDKYQALILELTFAPIGFVLVSIALWLTARRAASAHQLQSVAPLLAIDFSTRPPVLRWLPRLLTLVVPWAAAAGVYFSRVQPEFTGRVSEAMQKVFEAQFIRSGLDPDTSQELAAESVTEILLFDTYMLSFSGSLILLGIVLLLLITLLDRPWLARNLMQPKRWNPFLTALVLIAVTAAAIVAVIIWPVHLPQAVGALFVMSFFLMLLQLILFQLQAFRQITSIPLIALLVVCAIAFSAIDSNDNHSIRAVASSGDVEKQRQDIGAAFGKWIDARTNQEAFSDDYYPIYIVAAQGGGIYAAKHAASFLSEVQDLCPGFAHHLFAISGVSGGSVGASVFASLTRDMPWQDKPDEERFGCVADVNAERSTLFTDAVTDIFRKDLWAPLAASMLFPDFLQRFLPLPIDDWDRARWLEYAVEDAYDHGVVASGFVDDTAKSARPLSGSFLDIWDPVRYPHTPALVLNATEVASGERLVVSPFSFQGVGLNFLPIWDEAGSSDTVQSPVLSAAAGVSARFPWITPAAHFYRPDENAPAGKKPKMKKIRLVDGGYFENSGVATSLDMIKGIVKQVSSLAPGRKVEVNLLVFTSAEFEAPEARALGEAVDPIRTMFSTRTARGGIAVGEAISALKNLSTESSLVNANVIRLELNGYGYPLPLGWRLSPVTRHLISFQNGAEASCKEDVSGHNELGRKITASCAKKLIYDRLR